MESLCSKRFVDSTDARMFTTEIEGSGCKIKMWVIVLSVHAEAVKSPKTTDNSISIIKFMFPVYKLL